MSKCSGFFAPYKGVSNIFSKYWQAYGGIWDLIRSPYLHLAILLTMLTYGVWSQPKWWELVISVIPSLLGFTLGGFAIFLSFGDEKFKALLAEKNEGASRGQFSQYVILCVTFVHFILVQVLAFVYAIIAKATWFYYPWPSLIKDILPYLNLIAGAIGFCFFLYAITALIAATMHMLRIATWYEMYSESRKKLQESSGNK